MDDRAMKDARLRAEKAVADMPDRDLKVKAFEVILTQLITSSARGSAAVERRGEPSRRRVEAEGQPKSLSGRILALQAESFFDTPQAISGVREGLRAHGWHYPLTTLSGALQGLVQKRKLRRERVKDNNKMVWKYSNP